MTAYQAPGRAGQWQEGAAVSPLHSQPKALFLAGAWGDSSDGHSPLSAAHPVGCMGSLDCKAVLQGHHSLGWGEAGRLPRPACTHGGSTGGPAPLAKFDANVRGRQRPAARAAPDELRHRDRQANPAGMSRALFKAAGTGDAGSVLHPLPSRATVFITAMTLLPPSDQWP